MLDVTRFVVLAKVTRQPPHLLYGEVLVATRNMMRIVVQRYGGPPRPQDRDVLPTAGPPLIPAHQGINPAEPARSPPRRGVFISAPDHGQVVVSPDYMVSATTLGTVTSRRSAHNSNRKQ
jgi:hypothetical protein